MWPKIKPYILILPALLTTITLFLGGIFGGIIRSLSAGKPGEISFYAYAQIFSSQDLWTSFLFTLRYAAFSVLIASFLSLAIVFGLFYVRMEINSRLSLFLQRLLQLPMLFPFLVAAYIVFILLSPHGWLARLLFKFNLAGENSFPLLVNDPFGWGIIIAYVFKTCPFIILMLYPVILKIPKAWLEAGKVLGISQAGFFRKAVFPLLIPPLKTASFIVFAYTFLAFEIPYILGITYPKAVAVYAYQLYTSGSLSDRPLALAIIITSLLLIAIISYLIHVITRRWGKNLKPGEGKDAFQTV